VNQLYAGQDPPGVEEALESEHRAHAAFYPPVILFDNVVQVGTVSDGAKLMSAWDGFMPRRGYGLSPGFQPLGTIQPKRVALNGRKITWTNLTHIAPLKKE
jgi:hypothetical protein